MNPSNGVISGIILSILYNHADAFCAFSSRPSSIQSESIKVHPASSSSSTTITHCSTTKLSQSSYSDILVLSYDGVIANTDRWRANLAIDVTLITWPHLHEHVENTGTDWLINKVSALLPVTLSGENGMVGCDAVLLTRLLIEEQLLDRGKSDGCRGKYASKFHPSGVSGSFSSGRGSDGEEEEEEGGNSSRPLTVGEISANWIDGACLRDTVRVKYNIDKKDPIPIIKQKIKDYLMGYDDDNDDIPKVYPLISEALLGCKTPVFILAGDKSHISTIISSLSQTNIPVQSIEWDNDESITLFCAKSGIIIVPPGEGGRGHQGILQQILISVNRGSFVNFIHSDVVTLKQTKRLFGDNRPNPGMFDKAGFVDTFLKLSLYTVNSAPQQQNDAIMDPWLNVIDENDLVETLSFRIVP